MKILSLQAENVKKLVAVEIRPDGNLVQITGANGAGKTSILDAIWWCIAGATHIQSAPIRNGATEARIRIDLGELVVTRTFRQKDDGEYTTAISVTSAEGAKFPSPQRMLDGLLDALAFDPLAFSRMESRKQYEALRKFVPGVDFEKIDGQNKADYDARTDANRRAKDARAAAGQVPIPQLGTDKPIDVSALVADLEKAGKHNAEIDRHRQSIEQAELLIKSRESAIAGQRKLVELCQAKLAEAASDLKKLEDAAATAKKQLADARKKDVGQPIDTKFASTQINEANAINRAIERHNDALASQKQHTEEAGEHEAEAVRLTKQIEARTAEKHKAIAAAKLPVEGLGFGDGCVLLNGVPFEQASDAEQLRASCAIAMSGNPRLRVCRVRDGSLLDEASLALLGEMAAKLDFQVWIERVDSSGKTGFVIEDGHVRGVPPATAVAAANGKHPEILGDQEVEHEEEGELQECPF